jgi:MoaA/NifB/PqqE/SkfB family radical SAM enzyme
MGGRGANTTSASEERGIDDGEKVMANAKAIHIAKNYITGKLRFAEFAVTNACIARCSFCNIWKQRPKVFVDGKDAIDAIDRMADLGVSHICFTGGEALMHPDIVAMVERATKRKMNSAMLIAAPQLLLRDETTKRLAAAGNDTVSISFDSADAEVMAESRRIPNIMDELARAMEAVKRDGLRSMASVLIWNGNRDKLSEVFDKAIELGFDFISLNYPTFSESDVYELGGDGILMSKEELIASLEAAIDMKRSRKYPIVNLARSMENIVRYLRDPADAKFPCFGGNRVLFVDWFLNVHPCMQLPDVLGNILTLKESDFVRTPCNRCNMSWYRDLSAFFGGGRSIPLLCEALSMDGKFL